MDKKYINKTKSNITVKIVNRSTIVTRVLRPGGYVYTRSHATVEYNGDKRLRRVE